MGVVTFEPHPRSYFAPNAPYFRLMSPSAKATRLEKLGVSKFYELNFNAALSKLNPEEFARNVLSEGFKTTARAGWRRLLFWENREAM